MLNKKFIHAMELGVMLGLSTSALAYNAPDAPENWAFDASNAQHYKTDKPALFTSTQDLGLPATFDISVQATQRESYTQAAYSKFSISTNFVPESSRWYIQANASTRIKNSDVDTIYQRKKFILDAMPYQNERYVAFPNIVKTGIPILAPALEVGLNKMVRRRLRKTAELYGPYLAERHLMSLLELNRESQAGQPILEETDLSQMREPQYRSNNYLHNSLPSAFNHSNTSATQFDFNQSDDMNSVLAYYKAAGKSSSVRVRGEMGYKSERLNWRFGGQKQKLQSSSGNPVNEKNINIYSALNLKISDRVTYFNVTARETSTNTFGVDGLSTTRDTNYHRLNYNLSDGFSIFAAQGKIDHDIFGKTQSSQIGVKNCWAKQGQFSFCGSLGHQNIQYDASNSSKVAQDDGSGYMGLMTFKMTL